MRNNKKYNYGQSTSGLSNVNGPDGARTTKRYSRKEGIDIELFAGAGGMAVGLTSAGIPPDYLFETQDSCIATLVRNASNPPQWITGEVHREDVGSVDWLRFDQPVRLLSGGPPCQPFSNGGKHLADQDERNQFPATLRAIRLLKPAAILLENVPGLNRGKFRAYLDYIVRQLEYPSLAPRKNETWQDHDNRLRMRKRSNRYAPEYHVNRWMLNAADHGVGQSRTRVFLVATRAEFSPVQRPEATHGRAALIEYQRSGAYWRDRKLQLREREIWPRRAHGETDDPRENVKPWVTVRDVISTLPKPLDQAESDNNHWLIPGARIYQRHTGTELDWPAKTIKAGVHGVAGGENVVHLDDGSFRYFTLRELAKLQGFPDDYIFEGPRSRIISQIGNAVPCELARCIGESILQALARPAVRSPKSNRKTRDRSVREEVSK